MCPPGYHHNGIMAARELGHTMYISVIQSINQPGNRSVNSKSNNQSINNVEILVALKKKCSAAVAISRRKSGIIKRICHHRHRVLNYLKVHANTCRLHGVSMRVIFHSTNERSHWITDNISNPNRNNSMLLKSVSYCYIYCSNDQWNISFSE